MRRFTLCPACQAEYDSPLDRRFHAQPNACPACGPHVWLFTKMENALTPSHAPLLLAPERTGDAALVRAAELICAGKILAVKGLGGFH